MSGLIQNIPAVALRGVTVIPDMVVHFDISRDKSKKAVEKAMLEDQKIFLVTQRDPEKTDGYHLEDLYTIGTIAEIRQVIKMPKNILRILVEGIEKAELTGFAEEEPYILAEVITFEKEPVEAIEANNYAAMLRVLKELFMRFCMEDPKMRKETAQQIMEIQDLEVLMNQIATNVPFDYEKLQDLLESTDLLTYYERLTQLLHNELEIMRLKMEIQTKVKERVDKNQREYILREQLKLIREELGDDTTMSDADQFMEQVKKLKAPPEVKEKIRKEIGRLKNSMGNSAEGSVLHSYIETLLEMPWDKMSRDNKDLINAQKVLDEDHYGLEKVKERVLEFLAVKTLTKKGDSPILCLVGPPGTGKTSIARSVARALNKKYVRISLGGVRDEAEIRGHRKTYVGAMPGRIASGLRQAGVKNPLMLFDEIDKMGSDYKGDISSAMLEVLDSEQNNRFRDHYIECPLDLSEVLFIATANSVQTIPQPLLDRMELIEVSSYTENEKLHIAKEHLVAKQLKRHGLKEHQLSISDNALKKMIHNYTREAGVRNLERRISEICRKAAREILSENREQVRITETNIAKYLGKEKYLYDMANEKDEIGIVRGLAWTSVGGDTLQIEVNIMPGKGEIALTGQLGDVMKESARAGISYIRSISDRFEIAEDFFRTHDIHIHIPEGGVPKDGPSAGITMATAILSAVIRRPVRADVAMTGEITLRGRVLPIGGLKEKLLAAKSARVRTVIVPEKNRRDVAEISQEIRRGMEIVYAEQMDQVLEVAMAPE